MKLLPVILAGKSVVSHGRIMLMFPFNNALLSNIVTSDTVRVRSIYNGEPHEETYPSGTTSIAFLADKNTPIFLYGGITKMKGGADSVQFVKIQARSSLLEQVTIYYQGGDGVVLESADFSNCANLTKVILQNQKGLTTIKVPDSITEIDLSDTKVKTINLTQATHLSVLKLSSTRVEALNISACRDLQTFYATNTPLRTIDFSNNQSIKEIYLSSSMLEEIDTTALTELVTLKIAGTKVSSLDISNNVALATLDVEGCFNLAELNTDKNVALASVIFSKCSSLAGLDLSHNPITGNLSLSDCYSAVRFIGPIAASLTTVYLIRVSSLEYLDISGIDNITNGFVLNGCPKIKVIKSRCNGTLQANAIASAITAAETAEGVVYLNDQDTYYSTVADAATAKGWTIEPLA